MKSVVVSGFMPELPEVEVVKEGLKRLIGPPVAIEAIEFLRKDLRSPFPAKSITLKVTGQPILDLHRRAKYIVFDTPDFKIISHLGMTGSWRMSSESPALHDHVVLSLSNGKRLIYRDPRRFGVFDIVDAANFSTDKRFKHLGPEPFDESSFNLEYLFEKSRRKNVPVKNFIMDQRVVVGVGNIYASEALYMAGVSPLVQAGKVSQERYKLLISSIRKILKKAIQSGGSTIRDFAAADGDDGSFQQSFKVYGRDGETCRKCGSKIKNRFLSGRNTFWCVKCQR